MEGSRLRKARQPEHGVKHQQGFVSAAIEAELGVPVKLAGVGEGIDDLAPFEPEEFIRSLFEDA